MVTVTLILELTDREVEVNNSLETALSIYKNVLREEWATKYPKGKISLSSPEIVNIWEIIWGKLLLQNIGETTNILWNV